jgi:excinuclease ABC subunit A
MNRKEDILIKNSRVHNLKNLTVSFKRDQLTVVTGVSGSGKSSLVFDTLFAEGQRRYVESLSAYARQFLGRMQKPDVDYIKGISPAIAIEQKVNIRNPRSTVATSTEIYDYLKLLFARVGKTFSPMTKGEVKMHSVKDVLELINRLDEGTRSLLLVPISPAEGRTVRQELEVLMQKGFSRIYIGEDLFTMEEYIEQLPKEPVKKPKKKATEEQIPLFLLVDRFVADANDEEMQSRIADSTQTAFLEGGGACIVKVLGDKEHTFYFNNKFEIDGMRFEIPSVNFFAFNNPYGACKTCEGYGSVVGIDENLVIPNKSLSVYEGAVSPWKGEVMSTWKDLFIKVCRKNDFPIHRPYNELDQEQLDFLWHGGPEWKGIDGFFQELEAQTYKIQYRVMLSRYRGKKNCPDCLGTKLRKDTSYVRLVDKNYAKAKKEAGFNPFKLYTSLQEILLKNVSECLEYFESLDQSENDRIVSDRILKEIVSRLQCLEDVGLGYLSLNRTSNTLSGGESQRINLATSLGSSLVGSLYILDEPSIGLHSRDTQRLIKVLKNLKELGNTVIIVEHDEEIMEIADELIDIGPLAGSGGGHLVYQGKLKDIQKNSESLTGKYLHGIEKIEIPAKRRKWTDYIELKGASENNLKNVVVKFPLHTMTCITGVSGSGKTSLVKSVLYPALQRVVGSYTLEKMGLHDSLAGNIKSLKQIELIDQNPIGKSSRSNPVTYIKAYDAIRDLYASQSISKARSYKSSHFSFNVEGGRCDTCQGEGETTVEMQFMADIKLLCEECNGLRFKQEVLEVLYRDKNIGEVLNLTVDEALEFFEQEKTLCNKLRPLQEVGLGYVKLGQSASTLSGGEAQRVKLASFLGKGSSDSHILFIFDEPTTGLHFHDIKKLLKSFDALINQGHSILIIEHNLEVIKCADWIIDMGPEGGEGGGNVVFEGTPEDLVKSKKGYTSKYLARKLK